MGYEAYLTLVVVIAVLVLLISSNIATDVILMSALAVLVISGVLTPAEGLEGFSNPGVMTIATLYIVSAGLKETGAIQFLANKLLGSPSSTPQAMIKVILPTSFMSAFMNNETLSQLEQLIDKLIHRNSELESEVKSLKDQTAKLIDENETLQLEVLDSEEKQKEASSTLTGLLEKLQSVHQAS